LSAIIRRKENARKSNQGSGTEYVRYQRNLAEEDRFLVVSHHDADGVTACAVMVELLTSLGKDTEYMILKQLDSTTVAKVKDKTDRTIVFTDMGSGQQSILRNNGIKRLLYNRPPPPGMRIRKPDNPTSTATTGLRDKRIRSMLSHSKIPWRHKDGAYRHSRCSGGYAGL